MKILQKLTLITLFSTALCSGMELASDEERPSWDPAGAPPALRIQDLSNNPVFHTYIHYYDNVNRANNPKPASEIGLETFDKNKIYFKDWKNLAPNKIFVVNQINQGPNGSYASKPFGTLDETGLIVTKTCNGFIDKANTEESSAYFPIYQWLGRSPTPEDVDTLRENSYLLKLTCAQRNKYFTAALYQGLQHNLISEERLKILSGDSIASQLILRPNPEQSKVNIIRFHKKDEPKKLNIKVASAIQQTGVSILAFVLGH